MSRRRKHVVQDMREEMEPPKENEHIVRALGGRGSNIVEVEFPDGRQTLCLLPAKFVKKVWIRKGGYLVVENSKEAEVDAATKITSTVVSVLFNDHIKQLAKLGVWPPEFNLSAVADIDPAQAPAEDEGSADDGEGSAAQTAADGNQQTPAAAGAANTDGNGGDGDDDDDDSDDGLPPLERNNNRKVIYHEVTSESEDEAER